MKGTVMPLKTSTTVAIALAIVSLLPGRAVAQRLGQDRVGSITGNDAVRISYFPSPSSAACRTQCEANGSCTGMTWIRPGYYNPGDPGMCYLFSYATQMSQSDCCVTAVREAAPSSNGFGPREGSALTGTTLTYYPRPSVDQCQSDCAANTGCQGFTWIQAGTYNPTDAAMCYLLSAVTGRNPAAGHVSAVKGAGSPPNPPAGNWTGWLNRDDPGGSGDWERVEDLRGSIPCAQPIAVQCRTRGDGVDWRVAGQRMTCALNGANPGAVCLNSDNPAGCRDYEVRFDCGGR